ncbi:PREDICTED: uncharacterized protein LOC107881093 [Prunus mume]|uniref:Uncharacterized protein LOC107881093 n=1 Tax=Prunus mume TaxID=102107 RepID=A0ABM1LQH5_PRUMU|nr:PREDICTED: uncharacterized protein LOC107881093 [Prunus mume]
MTKSSYDMSSLSHQIFAFRHFTLSENLKSLSKRIHTLAALQHLSICDLPNLESFAEDGGLPPDLLYFTIENCNRLRASVGEHWDLQGLVSLEEFTIGGRGSDDILEMLLKQQLLPSTLYILHINRLSSLKSLDRKGLKNITSLSFLSISKCFSREKRRLLSPLNTTIGGGGSDDIFETLLKEQLLPSALHTLRIWGLSSLKSLDGKGLGHLTSLRELYISECDSIQFTSLQPLWPGEAAAELGISDFLVASNSQEVVALLKGNGELWSNLGNIVDDIRRLLVELCVSDVIFQPRLGNQVAHSLAQFGLREQHHSFWDGLPPDWLVSLLVTDMEGG